MFFDFFKKNPKIIEVDEDGNVKKMGKKTKWLIFIIVAAVFVLAFSGSNNEGNKTKTNAETQEFDSKEYTVRLEEELEEVLNSVKGAGKVKVRVTLSEYGEKVLASDKKKETIQQTENDKTNKSTAEEQNAIIYGSGSEEKPFVLKEMLPKPAGVLVVAEGGGDETVKLEIYEAVKALYGISGHRIKVAQGQFLSK